ncbi:hypothetical protein [Rhizobium sp. 21-4511-3d]
MKETKYSEDGKSNHGDDMPQREPAEQFCRRLANPDEDDIDLEQVIAEHRKPHKGIDLR